MPGLSSSQLAKSGGINLQSVRFYEQQGLLPRPPRTRAGYRVFPDDAVRRVRFIKRAQELGFTLKEIKELLALRADSRSTCGEVRRRADAKRVDIEAKIRDLRRITRTLGRLAEACGTRQPSGACPILESLDVDDVDDAINKAARKL